MNKQAKAGEAGRGMQGRASEAGARGARHTQAEPPAETMRGGGVCGLNDVCSAVTHARDTSPHGHGPRPASVLAHSHHRLAHPVRAIGAGRGRAGLTRNEEENDELGNDRTEDDVIRNMHYSLRHRDAANSSNPSPLPNSPFPHKSTGIPHPPSLCPFIYQRAFQ